MVGAGHHNDASCAAHARAASVRAARGSVAVTVADLAGTSGYRADVVWVNARTAGSTQPLVSTPCRSASFQQLRQPGRALTGPVLVSRLPRGVDRVRPTPPRRCYVRSPPTATTSFGPGTS